ncbi:MAG: RNA polymerase sigma-70 factor (ECF subfamily) [Planctomycetota bacterium]|jgi:RNA polymerase sigma-70 factor (ECF subfamily)
MIEDSKALPDRVYEELYALAKARLYGERANHTLQPTALVNEAYMRMAKYGETMWSSRGRFRAVAGLCMRHILVQYARGRNAQKRGDGAKPITLVDISDEPSDPLKLDLLDLEEVLVELEGRDALVAKLIELRFFGGLTVRECSEELKIPLSRIKAKCRFGLAWLRMRLEEQG